MNNFAKRLLATILCLSMCFGLVLPVNAAGEVTFSATLSETNFTVSENAQTFTMTVAANQAISIDQFSGYITYDEPLTIASIEPGDENLGALNTQGTSTSSGAFMWYTGDANVDGVTNILKVTFNIPANTEAGDYSVGFNQLKVTADYTYTSVVDGGADTVTINISDTSSGGDTGSNAVYTANLGTTSTAVKVGDEVTVNILVGGTTKEFASSELNLTYTGLTFVNGTAAVNDGQVSIDGTTTAGQIKIIDHGQSTTWTEGQVTAYTLNFTVAEILPNTTGTASVTLSDAALSKAADASGSNLTSATVTVNKQEFTVTPADLKVNLSEDFNGASSVVYGEDYTFTAKDPNYDYVITVTGGNEATYNETTKTWSVADVTSDLTITATKTAKKFSVSIDTEDNFATVPTTGTNAATYKVDYTFTLKANEAVNTQTGASGWTYSVEKITIGGEDYTANNEGQVYTITGEAITGDIVITTKKTEVKPNEYTIAVNRENVTDTELVVSPADKVATDGSITLTLNSVAGYTYTVTYKFGDGEAQNVSWTDGENGIKTATITNLTGNVTISASKEVNKNDIAVTVSEKEYLALNGKTMYLVRVTSNLDSGYVYTYDGSAMYYSNEYNKDNGGAYVYLVINDANDTLTVEEALAQINIAQGNVAATVDYSGDVNMTNKIDANDAQLVWNMYSAKTYSDFTTVNMEKFLRADVDKDGDVDVDDASAVVTAVKNRTN